MSLFTTLCPSALQDMSLPFSVGSASVVLCVLHVSLCVCLSSKPCVSVSVWVTVSSSPFCISVSRPSLPVGEASPLPLPELSPVRARGRVPGQRDAQRRLRLESLRAGGGGRRAGATSTPRALPLGRTASAGRSRRGATGPASAAGGLRRAGTSSPWGGASSAAGAASSLARRRSGGGGWSVEEFGWARLSSAGFDWARLRREGVG